VASASPDFWNPKGTAPVNAKTNAAKPPLVKASSKTKIEEKEKQ
jgi:hypothetical protein